MRTHTICLALVIVLNCPFASAQWVQQNSGTTVTLYSVAFTDANTGTVVGDSGTILRTINGGTHWTSQSSGTTVCLHGVCFYNANKGTAVGDSGIILRTTNGGETWTAQPSGTAIPLRCIFFSDANTGTAVGGQHSDYPPSSTDGVILRTTNAGASWATQLSPTTKTLNGVCFSDANSGTAVGDSGTILRTTNGGATWTFQSSGTNVPLNAVSFLNRDTGIVAGSYSSVLCTTDGGTNWTIELGEMEMFGVQMIDANNGTVAGNSGKGEMGRWGEIWRTSDGGTTWKSQEPFPFGLQIPLYGVSFTDANSGTAVGIRGSIIHTTNGGFTSVETERPHELPLLYLLSQNYPNPFNPSTTIKFELTRASQVTLSVFDILGREVSVLVNERREPGVHQVKFDGSNLASGMYFYRLQAGDFIATKRLLLLK